MSLRIKPYSFIFSFEKMSCPTLNLIIDLNNEGVKYLEKGNLEGAALVLRDALAATKELMKDREGESQAFRIHGPMISTCQQPPAFPDYESAPVGVHVSFPSNPNEGKRSDSTTTSDDYVFRRAYKLNREHHGSCSPICSLTCMFNLALTHHLWALDPSSAGKARYFKSLQAATRLYELTYTMLMQSDDVISSFTSLLTLAIINNLAQIYQFCTREEQKAAQCAEHLISVLMYFQQCGELDTSKLSCGPILLSVSRLVLGDCSPSPAA
jgi:hypothetical protein